MILIERMYRKNCTLGILTLNNFQCFTLELPDLNNERNVSCIPEGEYNYFFRESNKNGQVLQLENVPNRTFIQIHKGNFTRQIQGCILVGDGIKFLDDDNTPDITNSATTLNKLLFLSGEKGKIKVVS